LEGGLEGGAPRKKSIFLMYFETESDKKLIFQKYYFCVMKLFALYNKEGYL